MFENVRIKERLTKAFVMVAAITAIGAVVGLAAMLVMSNRYSSALVNYGFHREISARRCSHLPTRDQRPEESSDLMSRDCWMMP